MMPQQFPSGKRSHNYLKWPSRNSEFSNAKWCFLPLCSVWWFRTFLFFHLLGRMHPTDSYFSEGLAQPPIRITLGNHNVLRENHRNTKGKPWENHYLLVRPGVPLPRHAKTPVQAFVAGDPGGHPHRCSVGCCMLLLHGDVIWVTGFW